MIDDVDDELDYDDCDDDSLPYCEFCGDDHDVEYTYDPYAAEILDDDTRHWICSACYATKCDGI